MTFAKSWTPKTSPNTLDLCSIPWTLICTLLTWNMAASERGCCVPRCGKTRTDDTILHSFPNPDKDMHQYLAWIQAVGIDTLSLEPQYVYKNRRVCHAHFESKFLTWTRRLSPGAVPTLFLPGNKSKDGQKAKGNDNATKIDLPGTSAGTKSDSSPAVLESVDNVIPGVSQTQLPEVADEDDLGSHFSDLELEYLEDDEDLQNEENKTKLNEKVPKIKSTIPKGESTVPKDESTIPKDVSTIPQETPTISTGKPTNYFVPKTYGRPKDYSRLPRDNSKTKRSIIEQSLKQAGIDIEKQPENKKLYIDMVELKKLTCAICLSFARKMYSVLHNDNLNTLQQLCDRPFSAEHEICWECNATLNKITRFRKRVLDSQTFFDNNQFIDTPSFSNLEKTAITHVTITESQETTDQELNDNKDDSHGDAYVEDSCIDNMEVAGNVELETTDEKQDVKTMYVLKRKPECNFMEDDPPPPPPAIAGPARILIKQSKLGLLLDPSKKPLLEQSKYLLCLNPIKTKLTPKPRIQRNRPKIGYSRYLYVERIVNGKLVITEKETNKQVCKIKELSEEQLQQLRNDSLSNACWKKRKYKCDNCLEKFEIQQQLDLHNLKHDPDAGAFLCGVCEQRFPEEDECVQHHLKHYHGYKCMGCGKLSLSKETVLAHYERSHYERRRACGQCGLVFKLYKDYNRHQLEAHNPNTVICDLCKNLFRSKEQLIKHLQTHQSGLYRYIQCSMCEVQSKGPFTHQKHMKAVHNVIERDLYCSACDHQSMTKSSHYWHLTSLKHINKARIPYEKIMRQCEDCGRFFTNLHQLNMHRKYFHTVNEHCRCDLCDKDFVSRALLKLHLRCSKRHKSDRQRSVICEICGSGFFDQRSLARHMYSHNEVRCFPCDICPSSFRSPHMLYRHRRKVHHVGHVQFNRFFHRRKDFAELENVPESTC